MTDISATNKPGEAEDIAVEEDSSEAAGPATGTDEFTAAAMAAKKDESAQQELNEWKNRATYLSAEIDNMRKRFAREKSDIIRMGNEELLSRFLPVIDNLDFAVRAAREAEGKVENTVRE